MYFQGILLKTVITREQHVNSYIISLLTCDKKVTKTFQIKLAFKVANFLRLPLVTHV
jgi:hypothetical protein